MKRIAKFGAAALVLALGLGAAPIVRAADPAPPTEAQKDQMRATMKAQHDADVEAQKKKVQEQHQQNSDAQRQKVQEQHEANVETNKAKMHEMNQESVDANKAKLVQALMNYEISADGQASAAENAGNAPLSDALRTKFQPAVDAIGAGAAGGTATTRGGPAADGAPPRRRPAPRHHTPPTTTKSRANKA